MLFTTIKEFRIQHDEELGLMRVEWIAGRDMQYLRPALVQLHLLAKQLQVPKILFDMDTMADLSVFDQIWLATSYLPTVMQLPIKQLVVVIGSKRVYNQQAIEVLFQGFRLFMKFDFQFFSQSLPGLQFLLGSSHRLPDLLAGWQEDFSNPVSAVATINQADCHA